MYGPLWLQTPSTDADEAEMPGHLLHVVIQPQAWDLEGVEEICSTQELQLGSRA